MCNPCLDDGNFWRAHHSFSGPDPSRRASFSRTPTCASSAIDGDEPVQPLLNGLQAWLESTRLSYFMIHSDFAWPTCECLHFLGLTLLIGTVGLFDLRMLGLAKGLSLKAMHRLIGWGVLGFVINMITGSMF